MSAPNPKLFEQTQYDTADGSLVEYATEITLRDLFAMAALCGQLANQQWPNCPGGLPASEEQCAAHWAYEFADAMLRERAHGGLR